MADISTCILLSLILLPACSPDQVRPDKRLHDSQGDSSPDSAIDTSDDSGQDSEQDTHSEVPRSDDTLILPKGPVRGIVVLYIDTMRADHLPWYGYERNTMPLTGSRYWRRVKGMRATASWTLASTASMLTGLEPARHGLIQSGVNVNEPFVSTTWAEVLSAEGFHCALFSGNPQVSNVTGLANGFERAFLSTKPFTGQNSLAVMNNEMFNWLDELEPDARFMVHIQPMDLHDPYGPSAADLAVFRKEPIPFPASSGDDAYTAKALVDLWGSARTTEEREAIDQAAIDLYDAGLLGLDRSIDDLMNGLDERGRLNDTLFVLSSDHGETLNDPMTGLFGHKFEWREELVKVPLLFMGPGIERGSDVCDALNVDIWATIAAATGLKPIPGIDGIDLAEGCRLQTRGSLWDSDGLLWWLGVASKTSALQRNCITGEIGGTEFGPRANPQETTPAKKLPDGKEQLVALDQSLADILPHQPDVLCQ